MKLPISLKLPTLSSLQTSRGHPSSISHFIPSLLNPNSPTSALDSVSCNTSSKSCSLTTASPLKSPLQKILNQVETTLHRDLSSTFTSFTPKTNTRPSGFDQTISGNYDGDWMRRLYGHNLSPKQNLSGKWREYHGAHNWEGMLDPLDENLRREIIKYGEFAQATYDAFNSDPNSTSYADCLSNDPKSLFDTVGLKHSGYKVTKYLYATPSFQNPSWLTKMFPTQTTKQSHWMGFVAVNDDLQEIKRLGRRDIVISWRGTMTPFEWAENLKIDLKTLNLMPSHNSSTPCQKLHPKVENGFLSLYTNSSKEGNTRSRSASEQVMEEVERLVELYKGEELSITITGHSLGASLALLTAYEIGEKILATNSDSNIAVAVFSFGGPRVGNIDFKERMEQLGVKTLRIVNNHDIIPRLPGMFLNEWVVRKLNDVLQASGMKENVYSHVGSELRIDHLNSPYLKHSADMSCYHNLEAYLHLVDGFQSSVSPFRPNAKRDYSLVNKTCNLLRDELMVPANWLQPSNNSTYINNLFVT